MTCRKVSLSIKKDIRSVICVEGPFVAIGGTSFQSYWDYANFIDINLKDVFGYALSKNGDNSAKPYEFLLNEAIALEKIKAAVDVLILHGERLTKVAISDVAKISIYKLFKYPSSQAYFAQVTQDNRIVAIPYDTRVQLILGKVQEVIKYLEDIGEPATTRRVGKLVGVDPTYFSRYPHISILLKESMNKYRTHKNTNDTIIKEKELLMKVRNAIEHLETHNMLVTQRAIGRIVGKKPDQLKIYPSINALLQQKTDWRRTQREQARSHEEDLLARVEAALRELEKLGKKRTLRAVGEICGVKPYTFKFYPRVRGLLMQRIKPYQERFEALILDNKDALTTKVTEAITLLENLGQPVTQEAVSQLIGVNSANFHYDGIKALFAEKIDQFYASQLEQSKQYGNELLIRVKEAAEQLKTSEQSITKQNISNVVGKSLDALHRYPLIKGLMESYCKSEQSYEKLLIKRDNHKNLIGSNKTAPNKEMLLDQTKSTLKRLEDSQQNISIRILCRALGVSQGYLYKWPEIISIIGEATQRTRSKALALKFQKRQEELIKRVLEAIQQLRQNKQRVSVSAIAKLANLSPGALYRYPGYSPTNR